MDDLIVERLKNGQPLTMEETKIFLDHVVAKVREDNGITDLNDVDCTKCDATSASIGVNMFLNNCDCELLPFKQVMDIELTHYTTIASVYTVEGLKNFLFDLTYIQFFKENYRLDNRKPMNLRKSIIADEQVKLSHSFINDGYVEFTEENFRLYIDGFLDAYSKVMPIDKEMAYQKLNDYIKSKGFTFNSLSSGEITNSRFTK